MEKRYDVIVIGAGNAGLIAALELVKKNKKVLVLESNNYPGGVATSFVRGRFEFEASLHYLNEYKPNKGSVYKLFEKLGLSEKIEFVTIPNALHVFENSKNVDYKMPFGILEFMEQMEVYVPGSANSLKKFFVLAEECKEALEYIEENDIEIDQSYLKRNFPDFLKVANYSVDKVLDSVNMPKKISEILSSFWTFFGSPTSKLSFATFASTVFSYIANGVQIPYKRSHEISLVISEEIKRQGGVIKYNSKVKKILFKDKKVAGVLLADENIFEADYVIANVSPTNLYGKLLPSATVPKEALRLTNSRILGARGFSIYLGLNQTAKDLGLNDYEYLIYDTLDSNKEYQNMSSIKNSSSIVTVLNNAIPSCSPKGTTIMQFTTLFMGDVYSKNVTENNYFDMKSKIAENIIDNFESTTGIIIKPYIEEIEIATPITYARYTNHPDGVILGYKPTGMDNYLPRLVSREKEDYFENIYVCGGFSYKESGYANTYLSGDIVAKDVLKDMRKEVE